MQKISCQGITRNEALEMISLEGEEFDSLIKRAEKTRREFFGNKVRLCSIINAKSGKCNEKCNFCAQSRYFNTAAPHFSLKSPDEILENAHAAQKNRADKFSIVTSGRYLKSKREIESIARSLSMIRDKTSLQRCASLGEIHPEVFFMLREAGLECYHHNVETAPSFHPKIVETHSFDEEVRVIEQAKEASLYTCCGGIFGMGESNEQRVELIFSIRDINPDNVPLNFLNPIKGTPLEGVARLTPQECLRIIAVCRLVMTDKHIIVCGGREVNLKDKQDMIFDAGATGAMIGNYLTTEGQSPDQDLRMIEKAGYEI
jgi:biotin synthase